MIYPYLGVKTNSDEKNVIVFFTEKNKGVVVLNEQHDDKYRFGSYNEYDEDDFDFLKEGVCVRLNN